MSVRLAEDHWRMAFPQDQRAPLRDRTVDLLLYHGHFAALLTWSRIQLIRFYLRILCPCMPASASACGDDGCHHWLPDAPERWSWLGGTGARTPSTSSTTAPAPNPADTRHCPGPPGGASSSPQGSPRRQAHPRTHAPASPTSDIPALTSAKAASRMGMLTIQGGFAYRNA
jgi:hypothetical protein